MESAVSSGPLRPADFVNFAGRAGQDWLFVRRGGVGRAEHPCRGAHLSDTFNRHFSMNASKYSCYILSCSVVELILEVCTCYEIKCKLEKNIPNRNHLRTSCTIQEVRENLHKM